MALIDDLSYEPVALKFGTSGLRALVSDMTDLECYINTRGFVDFVKQHYPDADQVYVAGDLRSSTPRIAGAVMRAVEDAGFEAVFLGYIATPIMAYKAFTDGAASVMVTGSHIPDDRNGIKYYKPDQEVMKEDEQELLACVAAARKAIYSSDDAVFNASGMLTNPKDAQAVGDEQSVELFSKHLQPILAGEPLAGLRVGVYQHSAVGRDTLVDFLERAGADVVTFGRSESFIPFDTENVSGQSVELFKEYVAKDPVDAIVTTDGDSDRPLIIDENGDVYSGDVLGLIAATELQATACAYPVSANDMLDAYLEQRSVGVTKTKIGSPYVIRAMNESSGQVVGWEVNGGFMVGQNCTYNDQTISPLETRDAFLPLLVTLALAKKTGKPVSGLFAGLEPKRYTNAGLVDMPDFDVMKAVLDKAADKSFPIDSYFSSDQGFGKVENIDMTDGIRIRFDNGDVAHLRGSGNAPQLRIYATANDQDRANQIVTMCVEDGGIFQQLSSN